MKKIAAAVTAAACLTLAGCSVHTGGDAAIVGDVSISQSQVNAAVDDLNTLLRTSFPGNESFDTVGYVLQLNIVGELAVQVLADVGLTITDSDRDTYVSGNFNPATFQYQAYGTPDGHKAIQGLVNLLIAELYAQQGAFNWTEFQDAMDRIPVQVNPRYGPWNVDEWKVQSNVAGDYSTPYGSLADAQVFRLPA